LRKGDNKMDLLPTDRLEKRGSLIVGCPSPETDVYAAATGISLAAVDYAPNVLIHGIRLTAGAGNIALMLENGGTMTLPFTVDSGKNEEFLRGYRIKKILKTGTTFNGYIYPLF
jgi:hypothetical protein